MANTTWSNIEIKKYPKLNKNIKTNCLVVGGGICGVLCAYRLKELGIDVLLVERGKIANERTIRTTATITALQDFLYQDLDIYKRKLYFEASIEAINEYKKLNKKHNFLFEEVSSYKYFNSHNLFVNEIKALNEIGYYPNSFIYNGKYIIEFMNQAQMNPMLLIKELINNIEIYEDTEITYYDSNKAYTTNNNVIEFNNIIITTGYPFMKIKGLFSFKLYQNKSYVIEIENKNNTKYHAIGSNNNDLYYRTYNNSLLIGYGNYKTGKNNLGFKPIINIINDRYKNHKIIHKWINQDTMSLDNIPYIGKINDNVYIACGFNMYGMTNSMISSILIRDLILNKDNKYINLFNPKRKLPINKIIKQISFSILYLLNPKIKRCKHLGCSLNFIKSEKTYECPCHGSKYDLDEKVIFGPTSHNM